MGKSKKSKVHGAAGDDLLDSSDIDSVGSSSTALSDLSTENVNSQEFVLNKYIDDLYEKSRWEQPWIASCGFWLLHRRGWAPRLL